MQCINELKTYFSVDRWQINQPIVKSDVMNVISKVKGVQSIIGLAFMNLYDTDFGYSGNTYDLNTATKNSVIYPSLDPSIFEIRFPNQDIKGRVVNY